ncbi:MAG: aminopeptidase [Pseudomonadales bacterium]|nr:aminopeptidase [Pseudomonadales bacterium]
MWKPNKSVLCVILIGISSLLAGCDASYYWQAVHGHWDLMRHKQPITELLAADSTPTETRQSLTYLLQARQFALEQLALEDNQSYLEYVELERDYVTWNVFATPELSMQNHTWCYPIAGCVSYRGYFAKQDAEHYAEKMQRDGYDVYVGGAGAYSTLGWFADPVLSTFLKRGELSLAALLFHELAHQVLYVQDDSVFNESFASTVESILLQRWVEQQGMQNHWPAYQAAEARHQAFIQMVLANKQQRNELFESDLSDTEKRKQKAALITALKADYEQFKLSWNFSGYDQWFASDLNNAQLSTIATYNELKPGFIRLFTQTDQNLNAFLDACRQLADQEKDQRHQHLLQLASDNRL